MMRQPSSRRNEIGWGTSEVNFIRNLNLHCFLGLGPLPRTPCIALLWAQGRGYEIYGVGVLGTVGNETNWPHRVPQWRAI